VVAVTTSKRAARPGQAALRLPSFGFTVFSGIVFGLLCWLLHNRDREVARNRAAAGAS